jgi:hypothetical protein
VSDEKAKKATSRIADNKINIVEKTNNIDYNYIAMSKRRPIITREKEAEKRGGI